MIYNLSNKIVEQLEKRGLLAVEDKEVIAYGLFSFIFNVYCFLLCLTFGVALEIPAEALVFFVSFLFLKRYAGGFHAQKEWQCLIITSGSITLSILLIFFGLLFPMVFNICIFFSALLSVFIIRIAPLEAENKPLDDIIIKKYKKYSLIRTAIVCVILILLLCFDVKKVADPLMVAIILEGVFIVLGDVQKKLRVVDR